MYGSFHRLFLPVYKMCLVDMKEDALHRRLLSSLPMWTFYYSQENLPRHRHLPKFEMNEMGIHSLWHRQHSNEKSLSSFIRVARRY